MEEQAKLFPGLVKEAMKGIASRDLWQVPPDKLHVIPGFNVRQNNEEYRAHLEFITQSMMANGYRPSKPMAGYVSMENGENVIYITDGHTRLLAVYEAIKRGAPIEAVPVVVASRGTSMEDLTVALVIDNQGKELSEYETALVCKRLASFGWDDKTIATRLGKHPQRVRDLLMLVGSDKEVRDMVAQGEVSASQAIRTLKTDGAAATETLQKGVATAKAAGKKKASAKHMAPAKVGYKAVVQALLEWSKATGYEVPEDLKPVLTLARKSIA